MKRNTKNLNTLFVEGSVYRPKVLLTLEQFEANLKAEKIEEGFFGYDKEVEVAVKEMIAYLKTLAPMDAVIEKWLYNKCSGSALHVTKWKNQNVSDEEKSHMVEDLTKAYADAKAGGYKYSLVYNPYIKGIVYANSEAGINFARSR